MAEPSTKKIVEQEKQEQSQTSGPSGATAKLEERERKFDDEGGAQPQADDRQNHDKDYVPVGGQHNEQNPQLKKGR